MFKAKLFKLGNSYAVYIPKESREGLDLDKVYTFELLEEEKEKPVYTPTILDQGPNSTGKYIPRQKLVFNEQDVLKMEKQIVDTYRPKRKKLVFNKDKGINELK